MVHLLSSTVTSELRRDVRLTVVSQEDLRNLLGYERQKALLNCADAGCLAEIGGALGAEQIVNGSLSQLGQTYVFILRRIEVRSARVLRDVERRFKLSSQDALLDAIPQMLLDLFPRAAAGNEASAEAVGANGTAVSSPSPAPWILAGVGGAAALTGLALLLDAVLGGHTQNGVTSYSYPQAQTANTFGFAGQGLLIGGAVVAAGGLTWALLRSPEVAQ